MDSKITGGEELMIVYVVEEVGEASCGHCEVTEVIGVYENKDKALAKQEEMEELLEYNGYIITTYDTETGEIVNENISS